jgi:hypothetical protein
MLDHASSSARRIVTRAALLVLALIAVAGAGSWALERFHSSRPAPGDRPPTEAELRASSKADAELAEAEKAVWEKSISIAPKEPQVEPSGERVRWFQGFGVSVESVPTGAMVIVNGQDRGETPLTTSVECKPGETVRVEVRRKGLRTVKRTTRCREDQLVELSVELE